MVLPRTPVTTVPAETATIVVVFMLKIVLKTRGLSSPAHVRTSRLTPDFEGMRGLLKKMIAQTGRVMQEKCTSKVEG